MTEHHKLVRDKIPDVIRAEGRMPVVEVALACGFVSAAHFSRAYRAAFGKPPQGDKVARIVARTGGGRERHGTA